MSMAFLQDKALLFKQIPFFSGLNYFQRRLIMDAMEVVEYKRGQSIYQQGSPADGFYCLISGRVEIFVARNHNEQRIEYLHRGKFFGFISILTGDAHSVSARAVTDTIIARIPQGDFQSILRSIPRLSLELNRMLSRRLKLKELGPKSIFESTIIAVYGFPQVQRDVELYADSLAEGLRAETTKKVILVESVRLDSHAPMNQGVLRASDLLIRMEDIRRRIISRENGVDVVRISWDSSVSQEAAVFVSLLTLLVHEYHLCVVPFLSESRPAELRLLSAADAIHLVMDADPGSLKALSLLFSSMGVAGDPDLKRKMKLLVVEQPGTHGKGDKLRWIEESAVFHQPIYATLPSLAALPDHGQADSNERAVYGKVIRRICRQVGEMTVGVALGSGASMGMAHIGVLKILEQENIPIDVVSGVSIGALIAGLWCLGYTAQEVEDIILENKDRRYLFSLDDVAFPLRGLLRGKHIHRFLLKYFGDKTFYDLKRPLKIVACDCLSMKQVIFDSGRLVDAILASVSIPGVFKPHRVAGRFYIDGGILNPLPTDVLVEAGVRKVISVNVLPSSEEIERTYEAQGQFSCPNRQPWRLLCQIWQRGGKQVRRLFQPNIFDVIVTSVQSMEYLLAQASGSSQSDVVLHPDMTCVNWSSFGDARDLIRRGEEETRLHLSEIRSLVEMVE